MLKQMLTYWIYFKKPNLSTIFLLYDKSIFRDCFSTLYFSLILFNDIRKTKLQNVALLVDIVSVVMCNSQLPCAKIIMNLICFFRCDGFTPYSFSFKMDSNVLLMYTMIFIGILTIKIKHILFHLFQFQCIIGCRPSYFILH